MPPTIEEKVMVGIGVSGKEISFEAGQDSARKAMREIQAWQPTFAIAFCGGHHDPDAFLEGIHAELGKIPVVGGSSIGIITNNSLGYTGFESAVSLFSAQIPPPTIIVSPEFNGGTREAGKDLGMKLRESVKEGSTVVVFYDSIQSSPPPVLHVGSQLVDGIYEGLAGHAITIVGAGTIGDFGMTQSFIFDGSRKTKHGAIAIAFPPAVHSKTVIMHGCIPVSSFYEVTKIDGPVLYELDGKPALEILGEVVGRDYPLENVCLNLTLGEKHGDLFSPFDESAYINRLILNCDADTGSLTLFEADFQVGSKVQFMSRDNQRMLESAQEKTNMVLNSLDGEQPVWALYIDCAGRSRAFNGADVEEAGLVQDRIGQEIPFLGFYSGVEIAPILGRSRPLDWTGVLTVFTVETKQ